ncbi:putative FeS cluster biogenesis domain-containing protein [Seiridium unicorne]|uniref:FeS cluster biogenesis domain-containing protein n=1 Tax=Seiridium unicorne TaxID=138068 RepID=A0ABR2UET1_9PEZI
MPPRCLNPPSAAKLFVQLSTSSRQSSFLDVFLPRQSRTFRSVSATQRRTIARPIRNHVAANQSVVGSTRRAFSVTSQRSKTQAIRNPQADEDGNEMMLEITPRAAQRLTKIMTKDDNPYLALRIQVESGGCHGFQYRMGLVTLPSTLTTSSAPESSTSHPPSSETEADMAPSTTTTIEPLQGDLSEDDTIFAFAKDDASPDEINGQTLATAPKIVLDGPSLDLLKGSKLDFTMELIGSQFKIVDNPSATSSCGCGTSFDIKM